MTIEHIAMYERPNRFKTQPIMPSWLYEQKLSYPHHPKHSELIANYQEAERKYSSAISVLQSAFARKREVANETPQLLESIKRCGERVEQSEKELAVAKKALLDFNNHESETRINLYKSEISVLEEELKQATAAESLYISELLEDPDVQRKRLERQIRGEGSSEYSSEQMSRLRQLRGKIESIQGKIFSLKHDIQRVRQLVAEAELSANRQAVMNEIVSQFSEACKVFQDSWNRLVTVAIEYDVDINSCNLKVPQEATFVESKNPRIDLTYRV